MSDVADLVHDRSCIAHDIHDAGRDLFELRQEFVVAIVGNYPRSGRTAQSFLARAVELARRQGHLEGEHAARLAVEAAFATQHERFAFAETFEVKKAADRLNEGKAPQHSDGEPTCSIAGRRLEWLRHRHEYDMRDVVERFGMTPERYQALEAGAADANLDEARVICAECGCRLGFLMGQEDSLEPYAD